MGVEMPRRIHADWLKAYLEFTKVTESPEQFNYWVGVWTIAGALRRKVFLSMGHFQWIPNFYLFLVSPPGIVSKSTCLNIGASMLREIPGIHFGPEALTWQVLVEALAEAKEEVPFMVNGHPGFFPMSCISISAGELGTLVAPNNREMIDALVSLWDGKQGAWEKWTKTSGKDTIINPYINMASCTTPSWIALNFPEGLIGGGFTSRCIFVYADKKRRLIAYPFRELPASFEQQRRDLVRDLEAISTLAGEFSITEDAVKYGEEWYEQHYTNPPKAELERFSTYLARKQTHIHKVAMVLSAARTDDLTITADLLREANDLVTGLEPAMERVFEHIGVEGSGRHLNQIVQVLDYHKVLPREQLFSRLAFKMSLEEFEKALAAGTRSGLTHIAQEGREVLVQLTKER